MRRRNILGIVLVLAGIAWIINLSGVITVNWAASFSSLWPVVLIAIGASLMAGHRKILSAGIWVLTFALLIGFGIYKKDEYSPIKFDRTYVLDPLLKDIESSLAEKEILLDHGTEEGRLILNLGAVNIDLSDGKSGKLAILESNIPNIEQRLVNGKQSILEYSHKEYKQGNAIREFELQINPSLPWEIDANLAVADGKFDFSEIPLKQLDIKLGAGDLDLVVGKNQTDTTINLQAGATDMDIYIPKEAGLIVKSGKLLTNLSFHNLNMTNHDNVYISDNYENADQKIEMEIQTAVSAIELFAE